MDTFDSNDYYTNKLIVNLDWMKAHHPKYLAKNLDLTDTLRRTIATGTLNERRYWNNKLNNLMDMIQEGNYYEDN